MGNKVGHRQFGLIRQLPSKRWQASYLAPDGLRRTADDTFPRKQDADAWLSEKRTELRRGEWTDPLRGLVPLGEYAERWIKDRELSPRTREGYEDLWRLHIGPYLGGRELSAVTPDRVRAWRTQLLDDGRSKTRAAKAYRLLRSIMNTAVDDERIKRNPCRIKQADREQAAERPVATIAEVYALAGLMPARFRALVLAAALTGLRWGELVGLRRRHLDLDAGVIRVVGSLTQLDSGHTQFGPTKSAAGVRTVALPPPLVAELRTHVDTYVSAERDALVFVGPKGAPLRRANWRKSVRWSERVTEVGLPAGFHFHDLRHTGNHLAAGAGASTRELMQRMGHGTVRAALIYQHATSARDREIADALGAQIEAERPGA